MSNSALNRFAEDFQQEVLTRANDEGNEAFTSEAFVELFTEYLATSGEIEDATVCFYQGNRARVDAFMSDEEEGRLDLFAVIQTKSAPPVRVQRADVDRVFRRLSRFFESARDGLHEQIEVSSPAYDMAAEVHRVAGLRSRIRFVLLTDGLVDGKNLRQIEIGSASVSLEIWDVERLFRLLSSGQGREQIHIDFEEQFGAALPCVAGPKTGEYEALLALIPGEVLYRIYDEYGPRLLERNVRSFLQARGTVNRRIRNTIRDNPDRFLAYNNGISATAELIEFTDHDPAAIKSLTGLQIVNGAQTTASIHTAVRRDRADVSSIAVQAKIVIVTPEKVDEFIPRISEYSNSQNRITQADFSANHPFHVQIEELSRTVWAPSPSGTQYQTRWFYERTRGQYADEKSRRGTPARQREFEREFPSSQRFTKTDLAKYMHAYGQLPHLVSRGAQKNFVEFMLRLEENGGVQAPDVSLFQSIVAQALLFKAAEKLVSQQRFGGYRANIVAYTLAYLMRCGSESIDLSKIWQLQMLPEALRDCIVELSHEVQALLTSPPGGRNITEWCKTEACWDVVVNEVDRSPIRRLTSRMVASASETAEGAPVELRPSGTDELADEELIRRIEPVEAEVWFGLAKWAREAGQLQPWQRSLAYSLGQRKARGIPPSVKQSRQALRIVEQLETLGVEVPDILVGP